MSEHETSVAVVPRNGDRIEKHPAILSQEVVERKRLEIVSNWQGHLPTKMAYQLAKLSVAYGLDPFLKELVILGDSVYPTVAALQRKANEDENFDGEICRPTTEEERVAFYHPLPPPNDEYLWRCEVLMKNRKLPFVAWGRASASNVKMSTMQIWLPEMAQKRARGRAYRLAKNIAIPVIEEMYEFEDGTTMQVDKSREIELATPAMITLVEEKILVEAFIPQGLITQHEWDRVVDAMKTPFTKLRAEAMLAHFLGPKWDGKEGILATRREVKVSQIK